MSTTSGPVVPESTGKSRFLPSGSFSVAVFSAICIPLSSAQASYRPLEPTVVSVAATRNDVPELIVGQLEQGAQRLHVLIPHGEDELLEHQIELQQPATALPAQPVPRHRVHQTARLTISSLILLIACVGLRPFGHTSTQFMIV